MARRATFCAVLALFIGGGGGSAFASDITYDFTVDLTNGPDTGEIINGSFSFNSSLAVPGDLVTSTNALTALNFTWDGTTYTASTANTGYLDFDLSGNLDLFCFGNNASAGSCNVHGGTSNFWVTSGGFLAGDPTGGPNIDGTVTFSLAPAATPEPGTLGLLGTALLTGLGVARRRLRV